MSIARVVSALLGVGILFSASVVFAQGDVASIQSAYQQYKDIGVSTIKIVVPTVTEVPFDRDFLERTDFAVLDTTTGRFEPSYFMQTNLSTVLFASSDTGTSIGSLSDGNTTSYASFDVPGDRFVRSIIRLQAAEPTVASALTIALDANVALPATVAVRAGGKVVVAERALDSTVVRFPQTRAGDWTIEFTHVQPLRITEMHLVEDNVPSGTRSLRFLAQPNHSYRIYFNPDRSVIVSVGESGNLLDSREVYRIVSPQSRSNPAYIQADVDSDGVPDIRDNCASIANTDQADVDMNGLGDVCQDFDRDGVSNVEDNCKDTPNVGQTDADGDGIGDVCDAEESRLTEKYTWIPWVGIGFAAIVIVVLFGLTAFAKKEDAPVQS
ncbi:MAG: thrombospondin type 3 repeat-containing protein [bacterium]|nr:thrombospondin type 3 repeat-containing protein [bacterium]